MVEAEKGNIKLSERVKFKASRKDNNIKFALQDQGSTGTHGGG